VREGAAGAGQRGMAAHGAVTSGCGGAVKTTHRMEPRAHSTETPQLLCMPRQVLLRHVHAPASSRFGFGP